MTSDNEHAAQAAAAAERDADGDDNLAIVDREAALHRISRDRQFAPERDTWDTKGAEGFCHIIQEFLKQERHVPSELSMQTVNSWANGTLPRHYEHYQLARLLGLSLITINRSMLHQWLYMNRDLDRFPLSGKGTEGGTLLYYAMARAGYWFDDVQRLTGFNENGLRNAMRKGTRIKARVQAVLNKEFGISIPDYNTQPKPFRAQNLTHEEMMELGDAYAHGRKPSRPRQVVEKADTGRVVSLRPPAPQQPVEAPRENKKASSAQGWDRLAALADGRFIAGFSIAQETIGPDTVTNLIVKLNGGDELRYRVSDRAAEEALVNLQARAQNDARNAVKMLACINGSSFEAALQSARL